tara:strand:- start:3600 stop:3908 length:309 start_codon:yes stop_codon:yes gene_type:complete
MIRWFAWLPVHFGWQRLFPCLKKHALHVRLPIEKTAEHGWLVKTHKWDISLHSINFFLEIILLGASQNFFTPNVFKMLSAVNFDNQKDSSINLSKDNNVVRK